MLYKGEVYFKEVFVLVLNPMTGGMEGTAGFEFATREELLAAYHADLVESYEDTGPDSYRGGNKTYNKSFRKNSRFEWMNPLEEREFEQPGIFGHGIHTRLVHVAGPLNVTPYYGDVPQ